MATLQRIRNRAGLLVAVIIGMAIFAFVLQDLLSGGKTAFDRSKFTFAEIDGNSVQYDEYAARVEKLAEYYRLRMGQTSLDEQTMESIREQTWQDMVREYVTKDEYRELGISVSTDEMMDMVQGRNPHPVIRSLFADPQTGILNRTFLVQFIRTMNEDPSGTQKTIWLYLEDEIMKDRAFSKYNNLIRKGLYITNLEAQNNSQETGRRMDFRYVVKRFPAISDSAITVSDNDLQKYYRDHEKEYKQESTRDLEYVTFDILPSEEDDRSAAEWINKMKSEFETVEDPVSLVGMESDLPFDDMNYTDGTLPEIINDFIFSSQEGAVYGPFFEESSYRMARLVEIGYLPDSVHARHILLQPDNTTDGARLVALADSLKDVLASGGDFANLARLYSTDGSAQEGGDLGWFPEGQMVKPFSDSCFYGKTGKIYQVQTQFGIHLIEVLAKSRNVKKVKVAYLSRNVEPSSETYQKVYSEAVKFAGINNTYEKFNTAVSEQNLTKRYANDITASQKTITGLEQPRALIRWAYEAELHDISEEIFEIGNKYVVGAVAGIREKGIAPLDQVRAEIELEVKKNKKAELISEEFNTSIASVQNIDELASEMGLTVVDANNVNFASVSVPSAGIEPNVIATASVLAPDELSQPVNGNNGVYVIVISNIIDASDTELSSQKSRMTSLRESQANYEAYEALREAAKIQDNRAKFF
jgi:peptidyl-prolyl cis-trans isomerase D